MDVDTGIEKPQKVTNLLNVTLADLFVLTVKTKKYHWNIQGPRFYTLHVLFEKVYSYTDEVIDEVAERITSLGGTAIGTLDEFVKASNLEEHPEDNPSEDEMIEDLVTDLEIVIKSMRRQIPVAEEQLDYATADMLTSFLANLEKFAWMLRSHLVEE